MKPSNTIRRYLELARKQALQSTFDRQRHGCVIVKAGRIINAAHNSLCYSSFAERFRDKGRGGNATRHAELRAILGVDSSLTHGATAIIVRINNSGEYGMSRPCSMCMEALKFVGIKKIIYTRNRKEIGAERL